MALDLLLVGGGKMGGALLAGWLAGDVRTGRVTVVEPDAGQARSLGTSEGLSICAGPDEVDPDFRPAVIVFAVKPQVMDEVVPHYQRYVGPDTVFLSIAAGKTIASFERHLGGAAAIVRAMPNTPAAIGRGMAVLCSNAGVTAEQHDACEALLRAVGDVAWVEEEGLLDPVTAVSGSGPAYVFLLVEAMMQAGTEVGLSAELAGRIARATVAGAGELLHQSTEPAATLRQNVTSPGGTTQAALDVLMGVDGWQRPVSKAITAATRRSRELAE